EGDDEKSLKLAVEDAGLTHNVKFTGYIHSFKEKFTYLAESKVFVLPSYEENWAIVIGEAMASGVPVVAYKLNELVQVWGDQVNWAKTGDTKGFAHQVLELLRSPHNSVEQIRRSLAFVKKLDWREIAEQELIYILKK
ncbi:MAG: glycosyltransferase, partial [Legionella sp.]